MDLARPLAVVCPTIDADVLAVLAGTTTSFTGRQVHQVAGRHSERGVRNTLHRLVMQGVVQRERVGASDLYTLNRNHLAARYIEALAALSAELFEKVSDELESWAIPAEFVALFGSAARGDMGPDSDLDLLVVRSDDVSADDEGWQQQLATLTQNVTAWTGNGARVLELSASEVESGIATRQRVLSDIRAEGIALYGPRSYLSRRQDLRGR